MQEDSRRIRAKDSDGNELTPGQAAALLNNEKGADKLRDEVQELQETLQVRIQKMESLVVPYAPRSLANAENTRGAYESLC